jgi:hypothetical protein
MRVTVVSARLPPLVVCTKQPNIERCREPKQTEGISSFRVLTSASDSNYTEDAGLKDMDPAVIGNMEQVGGEVVLSYTQARVPDKA